MLWSWVILFKVFFYYVRVLSPSLPWCTKVFLNGSKVKQKESFLLCIIFPFPSLHDLILSKNKTQKCKVWAIQVFVNGILFLMSFSWWCSVPYIIIEGDGMILCYTPIILKPTWPSTYFPAFESPWEEFLVRFNWNVRIKMIEGWLYNGHWHIHTLVAVNFQWNKCKDMTFHMLKYILTLFSFIKLNKS